MASARLDDRRGGQRARGGRNRGRSPRQRRYQLAALRAPWRARPARHPFLADSQPLLDYIAEVDRQHPDGTLASVPPERLPAHWWEQLPHNQTAPRPEVVLVFRPGIGVTSVPRHLRRA